MNKKTIVLALIASLLLIAGCAEYKADHNPVITTNEPIALPDEEEFIEQEQPEPEMICEEWANSMFPVQWVYTQTVTHEAQLAREKLVLQDAKWKDGSNIRGTSFTKVTKGSLQGENVNYYYSRPMYPGLEEKYSYSYSEDIIDEQGNILGRNAFTLRPYFRVISDLTKEENSTAGYAVKARYLSLVMVEPDILSCERAGEY